MKISQRYSDSDTDSVTDKKSQSEKETKKVKGQTQDDAPR